MILNLANRSFHQHCQLSIVKTREPGKKLPSHGRVAVVSGLYSFRARKSRIGLGKVAGLGNIRQDTWPP